LTARPRPSVACTAPPEYPELDADWPLQRAALADAGLDARAVVWSDPGVDWASFDLVVANGVWDYVHRPEAFLRWVERVGAEPGVRLVNAPATLRWNLDKRYLHDLEAAGVPVVPTTRVEPGDAVGGLPLPDGEVVVKPAISGGGFSTARYEPHDHEAARAHLAALTASGRAALVQRYEAAVDREGETGLVFLGAAFSHAVRKEPMIRRGAGPRPSLIENQVVAASTVTPAQLELGRRALAAAEAWGGPSTYARVDTVHAEDGTPVLLELELLDPVLFLTTDPAAAERFARVLAACAGAGPPGAPGSGDERP